MLAGVKDGDHVGVGEAGGGAGLGLEPEAHVGTSRHVGTQELDGHRALQPPVEASVDVGHAAAPQQSSQLVPLGDQLGFARGLHPRLCTRDR